MGCLCDSIPQSQFPFSPPATQRWLASAGSQCSYAKHVCLVSLCCAVQVSQGGQSGSGKIVKWHMLELGAHGICKTSILNGLAVDHLGIRDESNRCYAFKHLDKEIKTRNYIYYFDKAKRWNLYLSVMFHPIQIRCCLFLNGNMAWHNMTKP